MRHATLRRALMACLTVTLAGTAPTFADTLVEMTASDGGDAVVYKIKDGKVRFEGMGEDGAAIFNSADGSMTMLDARSKQYFRMDRESADQMAGAMNDAMAEARKRLAQLPPAQREQMMKMMPQLLQEPEKPSFTVERTGKKDEVAGIRCETVRVLRDGEAINEACVASARAAGFSKADYETMRSMFETMEGFSRRMGQGGIGIGAELAALDGVPVRTVDLQDGETTVVKTISDAALDGAMFEIPAGYTERKMAQFDMN